MRVGVRMTLQCARCFRGVWDSDKRTTVSTTVRAFTVYGGIAYCRKHVQEEWAMENAMTSYSNIEMFVDKGIQTLDEEDIEVEGNGNGSSKDK